MAARFDSGSLETYGAVQSNGTGVTVPDAALLFTGDYSRTGTDLTITGSDGAKFVVAGYFETDTPPSLISPTGGSLSGDVVTALAGPQFPGMYAQAGGGAASAAKEIGSVQTLEGSGTVIRANGVTETLKVGDPVYEGDVVMTGPASKMGIGFVDGTVFSMSASARMVLNSLVYDANGSDNSMLFSLVEGSFVFAAGQIAPTGDMKIQTPVATMGIRGTAPTVDIIQTALGQVVNFSIVPNPDDNHIGSYTLYDSNGNQIGTINDTGSGWSLSANGTITEFEKTNDDLLKDAEAINQINQVYNTYQNNTQNQQNPQAGPENNNSSGSGLNTNNPNQGENVDGTGQNTQGGGETPPPPPGDDGTPPGNNNPPPGDQTNNDDPLPEIDDPDDPGVNVINGTAFDDNGLEGNPPALVGTNGNDFIFGFAGDDHITALDGDDFVFGGPGNDTIVGATGAGDDHYDGGEDTDTVEYTSTNNDVIVNLVDSTVQGVDIGIDTIASLERFVMGRGNDTLIVDADTFNTGWFFDGGDGTDTIQIAGALNIDTFQLQSDAENIEIIDLNTTDANTLTISVDDFLNPQQGGEDEEPNNSLQIRGGTTDVVNLTNLMRPDEELAIEGFGLEALNVNVQDIGYDGEDGPNVFEGYWTLAGSEEIDGLIFDIYHFISPYQEDPLAVANIQQGIQVNFLIESFENGFEPNGWETINADISSEESTEGSSSAFLSTTTGNELDDEFGVGDSDEDDGGDDDVERGNAENIADLLDVNIEDLDDLADEENGFVIEGSAIQTSFYAMAGQPIGFDWFFTTNEGIEGEYGVVNDIAFVVINGEIFKLFDAESTGNIEGNTATVGWNGFTTILTESGWHEIGFGVLDNEDPEVETNLNIDNIRLGPATFQSGAFAAALMMFDVGSNQFPHSYDEAGMTVESHYGDNDNSGHIHLQSNALLNHSGCCSEPYHFELTDSGTFNFLGFTFTQISTTGGIWTSSKGGLVDLSGASLGDVDFSTNPDFQNVEWVEWAQPQGSSTIDNLSFSGGGHLVVTGTGQNDILVGQEFSEALLGLGGDDIIDGRDGDDLIDGGSGNNTLTGGDGADCFVISGLDDGIDTITDYEGLDALDLTSLLDGALPDGAELGDVIGQFVRAVEDGDGNVSIGVDTNGETGGFNFTEVAVLQNVGVDVDVALKIGGEETTVESAAVV